MKFKKLLLWALAVGICFFVGFSLANVKANAQETEIVYTEDEDIASIENLMPITEAEGDGIHLTQIYDPTYNPYGPSSSKNCGPASLAMCLRALGYIGYGNTTQLNSEQQVDHARALLYNTDSRITTITVYGIPYTQLNADLETSNVEDKGPGAIQRLGGESMTVSNQTSLDKALDNGMPVVLYGTLTTTWKNQFSPTGHWSGTGGHYIAVTGKTYDGYYMVNDPLYYHGGEPMTYAQLSTFLGSGVAGTAFYWKTPTPCAITKSNGISNVFMRRISDNKIYRTYQTATNGSWTNWSAISTTTVRGNPIVIAQPNGRLLLFARGINKNIFMFSEDASGNMSTVTDFGGETYYELGVCKNGDGRVEFYARGIDRKIYKRYQTAVNGGFSDWDGTLAGDMRTGASGALNSDNRIELFAGGRGNGSTPLMHTYQTVPNGAWVGGWYDRGGHCRSIPTAFRDYNALVLVFVRGADNCLYFKTLEDGWANWGAAGNTLYTFGRPAIATFTHFGNTDTQVFVRCYNNKTYWTFYNKRVNPHTWSNWTNNGDTGTATSDPAAARYANGRLYVVVRGTSGYLYYRLQSSSLDDNFAGWVLLGNALDFR